MLCLHKYSATQDNTETVVFQECETTNVPVKNVHIEQQCTIKT